MITEHERIVLTTPIPAEGLEAGDVGTVVPVYRDGSAYEVEFGTQLEFHMDSVVLTLYGKQQGARKGYNPRKKGRPSYHPILCFEAHGQEFWHGSPHRVLRGAHCKKMNLPAPCRY